MCGIAGIAALPGGSPATIEQLRQMCRTIAHRGPDDEGFDIEGAVGLGVRRLSVIDVRGGRQPIFNEDRSVRVVFNGEIYNFRELRRRLEGAGHRFASATDGEVIVHLWEDHGTEFVQHLDGMFAIALHDARRKRLVLVRDRLGIKPLFYASAGRHLVFGSEIKALLASGLVERRLDVDGLAQFLAWEYVPAPGTLLDGVRKLDAASLIELDLTTGRSSESRWWDVPVSDGRARVGGSPIAPEAWEEAVDSRIRESVRGQLVSDVPLGAFLSGGVDSSLVVAAMGEARTFSIGFDDPSYDEIPWSTRVARHLGVDHTAEVLKADVGDLVPRLMEYMDDPIGDFSIFPTYLVSRLARRDVTVALSGDGGDELFGGYETYAAQRAASLWGRVPRLLGQGLVTRAAGRIPPRPAKKGLVNKAKRFLEGAGLPEDLEHTRWRLFMDEDGRRRLLTPEALAQVRTPVGEHVRRLFREAGDRPQVDRWLYVDLRSYLVDNCLVKVDRMSMACSLEARVPLLDHRLVELAFQVPAELKVRGSRTKILLKRVAARHVPPECVYRPKEGFSIPLKHWLKDGLRPLMEDLLSPARAGAGGLFEPREIDRLKREHLEGRANHSHLLWSLMVFEMWRRRWLV